MHVLWFFKSLHLQTQGLQYFLPQPILQVWYEQAKRVMKPLLPFELGLRCYLVARPFKMFSISLKHPSLDLRPQGVHSIAGRLVACLFCSWSREIGRAAFATKENVWALYPEANVRGTVLGVRY